MPSGEQTYATNGHTSSMPARESAPGRASIGKRLAPLRLERMRLITCLSTNIILYGLRGIFGQHGSKSFRKNIGVAFGNDQRRAELYDIVKRAVRSG
jgi:hypothetical protein